MDAKCDCGTSKKKCNTNLVIASPKKQATTQGKSPTLNENECNKQSSPTASSVSKKMHNIALQGESKPGQRRQQRFLEKRNSRSKFFKIKILNFDWSDFFNEKLMA